MKLVKYSFVLIIFLLLMQATFANSIRVLYFFNPEFKLPQLQASLERVKNYWKDKIEWLEYDWSNKAHRYYFDKYDVVSLPVAVVECDGKITKVKRSAEFTEELNRTIARCYAEQKNFLLYLLLFFVACKIFVSRVKKSEKHRKFKYS